MKRELKFRAYSEQDAIMYQPLSLQAIAQLGHDFSDNIKLMQYTGLKDKNDVEIYEGDVLIALEPDEDSCMGREFEYKGVISYGNTLKISHYTPEYPTSFCLISKSFYKEQSLLWDRRWIYEVIGNIYENPELLEEKE